MIFPDTDCFFDRNSIAYMLSGSVAMSTYTVPRFTRDFDFVVHLKEQDIPLLVQEFSEGYYCDEEAVIEAVKNRGCLILLIIKVAIRPIL